VSAIQDTLAREHANVWWYGVLGGRTSATTHPQLFAHIDNAFGLHLRQRDALLAGLYAANVVPEAAAPTYPLLDRLTTPGQISASAQKIESENATAYAWLVSQATGQTRVWGVAALRNAAIRELDFQGTPENFPGADEFADR
jgi:Domain of unknown function (DUF4439)